MNQSIRSLTMFLLCSIPLHAADVVLPADVQAALAEYDQKVAKAKADLVVKLQKAQESATKKGDLDLAMSIKAKVGEFAAEEKPKPADPTALVGMWQLTMKGSGYKSVWTLDKKGNVTNSEGNTGKYSISDDKVTIAWDVGSTEHMNMPAKGARETTGIGSNGAALTFTKQ